MKPVLISFLTSILWMVSWCGAVSAQGWWERSAEFRTKYYNIKTDLPKEKAADVVAHMDLTFESYANLFKGLKLRRPARLDVYVFSNQRDYMSVLRAKFKNDGTGSAGKCITRGNVISLVAWKSSGRNAIYRLKRTLQHEGFHQFASNLFPRLPTWANEGLAEVFERGVLIDGKIVLGEVSASDVKRLRDAKERGRFRSMNEIILIKQSEWNQQVSSGSSGANYLQAWNICHCFLFAEDSKYQQQFMNFLKGINAGSEWQASFVNAFGVPDFGSMNEVWLRYVESLTPTDYRTTIQRMEFQAMGYLSLRERGIYPLTAKELKEELKKANFEFESNLFGEPKTLTSSDPRNFAIPYRDAWTSNPVFKIVDSKGKTPKPPKASKDEKKPSKSKPKPYGIETTGLSPINFSLQWKKDRKQSSGFRPVFSYK